jgi:ferredoxin-type protein NapH
MKPAVESKKKALIGAVFVAGFGFFWYFTPFPWLGIIMGLLSGAFTFYLLSSRRMETARRLFFIGLNLLVISAIIVIIAQMGWNTFYNWGKNIHEKEYYLTGQTSSGIQSFPCTRDVPQAWLGRANYLTYANSWNVRFPTTLAAFLITLIPYVGIGLLFGRGVCGWLCPFGGLTEIFVTGKKIRWHLNFLKRRVTTRAGFSYAGLKEWVKDTKYGLLATVVLLSIFLSFPLVCVFCPVFWLNPLFILWVMTAFILFFAVALPIMTKRRWWCLICPIGAAFGLINKISLFRIRIDKKKCIKCYDCVDECRMYAITPETIEKDKSPGDDCTRCGRCMEACPEHAIDMHFAQTRRKVRYGFITLVMIAALALYIWFVLIMIDIFPRVIT